MLAGFLMVLWRYALDPSNTGGSILALPIILVMFLVCIALFIVGCLTMDRSFGWPLVFASFLVPFSFSF